MCLGGGFHSDISHRRYQRLDMTSAVAEALCSAEANSTVHVQVLHFCIGTSNRVVSRGHHFVRSYSYRLGVGNLEGWGFTSIDSSCVAGNLNPV